MFTPFPFIFFLLLTPTVLGWGPVTTQFQEEIFFRTGDSTVAKECANYKAEFHAGTKIPDIRIFSYFTQSERYSATHNMNFVNNLFLQARADHPEERCFVYGVAFHMVDDDDSHNNFVAERIETYKIHNYVIHPIVEGQVEAYIIETYPETYDRAIHSMDILFPESPNYNPRLLEMVRLSLGETQTSVENEAKMLHNSIGAFYSEAFVSPGSALFGMMIYILPVLGVGLVAWWLTKRTWILVFMGVVLFMLIFVSLFGLAPVWKIVAKVFAGTVRPEDVRYWNERSTEKADYIYEHWDERFKLRPAGFERLENADATVNTWMIVSIIILVIVAVGLWWWKK